MTRTSTKVTTRGAPSAMANHTTRGRSDAIVAESRAVLPLQESRMNQIARRARDIYQARGGTDGETLEDWLQAEREIDDAMEHTDPEHLTHS